MMMIKALRKLQSANRPASAPVGSQRKRSLQNIIKSKVMTTMIDHDHREDGYHYDDECDDDD